MTPAAKLAIHCHRPSCRLPDGRTIHQGLDGQLWLYDHGQHTIATGPAAIDLLLSCPPSDDRDVMLRGINPHARWNAKDSKPFQPKSWNDQKP